jgi:NADH:ubiquinone oxidoreductase subunit E
MEALIHHFKLVTEGFRVPPGEVYYPLEFAARRLHRRPDRESGDARPDPRRHRPVSAREDPLAARTEQLELRALTGDAPRAVTRFAHGSRVPGWDEAVDLSKEPAEIPDPDAVEVPAELRSTIEAHMANYPERSSAVLPALTAAQRLHGWCSPEAIQQVAAVMRVTPAYLESVASFYDMLETTPVGRHAVYVCTNISCSLRGADALFRAIEEEAAADPDEFNVRAFECLGACDIAPMVSVDGVYVGPLEPGDAPRLLDDARTGREVMPEKQLARRPVADPRANGGDWVDGDRPRPSSPPEGGDS